MVDRTSPNGEWTVSEEDGTVPTWERAAIAVLMDIRRELKLLNAAIYCPNFQAIPSTLAPDQRPYEAEEEAEGEAEMRKATYYPKMPPMLPGETPAAYTDRLTGADGKNQRPYNHYRNRQCSIGYHRECTDPSGEKCECPCHRIVRGKQ